MRLATTVLVMLLVTSAVAFARTKTEAADLARQVNFTKSDFPGYKVTKPDITPLGGDRDLVKCAKTQPASQFVGHFQSKQFEHNGSDIYYGVTSEVDVLKTPEAVQKDLAAWGAKRIRDCIVRALKREGGHTLVRVTAVAIKPPVPNGTGLRVKSVVRSNGQKVPVYQDVFLVGHEDVELFLITQAAPHALDRASEDGWLQTVESRLEAVLEPPPPAQP